MSRIRDGRASAGLVRLWHIGLGQAWQTPWGPDILRANGFRGKRVVIVGPAETVSDDLTGTDVDSFDVVVRLNNGIALADASPSLLGRRTDLLFHNLKEDGERSAGAIPAALLRDRNVRAVVYPHWRTRRLRDLYRVKQSALADEGGPPVLLLPPTMMANVRADLDDRAPTIGTAAILFFLASPVRELAIHGFTFFETAYRPGYNVSVDAGLDARAWVDAHAAHEPKLEKALIRERLSKARALRVTLGRHVATHLAADGQAVPSPPGVRDGRGDD